MCCYLVCCLYWFRLLIALRYGMVVMFCYVFWLNCFVIVVYVAVLARCLLLMVIAVCGLWFGCCMFLICFCMVTVL